MKINAKCIYNLTCAGVTTFAFQVIHAFYKNKKKPNYLLALFYLIYSGSKNMGNCLFHTSNTN